jgi:putative transposase
LGDAAFTDVRKRHEIKISMHGRGRWMDNILAERLWRSLKHADVYLKGCRRPRGRRHLFADKLLSIWREGVTGALGANAVDMMDNAFALTTCPQQQQQTRPRLPDLKRMEWPKFQLN